nr:hypothetical protein [Tanacetum cinerariifolium]
TTQQPSEGELDLLFEAMYDDYIGGQLSATVRIVPPALEPQVRQTSTPSTTIADTTPTPTNSSSHAANIPITSQDSKYVLEILNKYGMESCDPVDADYAGCKDTFKSTSGGAQFLGEKLDQAMALQPHSSGKAYVEGEIVSKAFKILSMRVVTQDRKAA